MKHLQDLGERAQQVPDSIIVKYAKQIVQGRLEGLANNTATKGTAVDIQRNMQRLRTEHEASSNEADRRVRESIKGLRQEMDVKMDVLKRSLVTPTPMLKDSSLPQKVHALELQNTQLSSRYENLSQRLEPIEKLQGAAQVKLVQKMQQDMDTRLQAIEHKVCTGDLQRLQPNIDALRQRAPRHPRGTQPPQGMPAKGTVLVPHTRTPAPTARGQRTPTARPEGGRLEEGERLNSDAPQNGERHPPRRHPSATPTASNNGSQGRTL